jgi:hypothetical protein
MPPKPFKRVKIAVHGVDPGAPRRLLTTSTTSAVALLAALKALLGDYTRWEPETLWLELERRDINVPKENQVKIQAALTLLFVPSFYWDAIVFEKTALAFDGGHINPQALEEASTAQLAWAVREASWILSRHEEDPRSCEHEPAAYAGIVAHREGLVVMPSQLSFGQEQLDRLNASGNLAKEVKEAWKGLDWGREFTESPLDVQLARLVAVELHVQEREKRAAEELAQLG